MQRYFAIDMIDDKLVLKDEDKFHLFNVLRLKKGEIFQVVYNGFLYECTVENPKLGDFQYKISRKLVDNQYIFSIILGVSKNSKIETVLQKCTEIGINHFYIYESKRSVAKMDKKVFESKRSRFEKTIIEAAQQSKQDFIPAIEFIEDINKFDFSNYENKFVAYENELTDSITKFDKIKNSKSFIFSVGPEGGFSEEEISEYLSIGFEKISLGNSILRCETAPIYIASVVSFIKNGASND